MATRVVEERSACNVYFLPNGHRLVFPNNDKNPAVCRVQQTRSISEGNNLGSVFTALFVASEKREHDK